MNADSRVRAVADELVILCQTEGGVTEVRVPTGYPHLGLAVIDAVFSVRAHYDRVVVPVIDRYCTTTGSLRDPVARFDEGAAEHDLDALLQTLGDRDETGLVELFGNRQYAPGTSTRKAVVVTQLARALKSAGVTTRLDIVARWNDNDVSRAALGVRGVGPATWRYLLVLSGVEAVKPDTMVTRWVRRVLGDETIDARSAADLLERAARDQRLVGLSVRAADHLVWRSESGRL